MPELEGNITTVGIVDADLVARMPAITVRYLPPGATDFSAQIDAAKVDALAAFRERTGLDPIWVKAKDDGAWKRILSLRTILIVLRSSTDDKSVLLADRYAAELKDAEQEFFYNYDENHDGVIDEG